MDITITINTDNAAFEDGGEYAGVETARILREIADKYEAQDVHYLILRDVNGNSVGKAIVI